MVNAVVVGIDGTGEQKMYRIILCEYKETGKGKGFYTWNYKCEMLNEAGVKKLIASKGKDFFLNIGLDAKGEINGISASLTRFAPKVTTHHPLVIIAQCQTEEGRALGYSVATYDGRVKTVPMKEMIAYGTRSNKLGLVPVENAIFVPDEDGKSGYYKTYPEMRFLTSVYESGKNKYVEQRKVQVKQNEKALNRIDEIFTKEQIEQLRLAKANGVDYRIIGNPNLSANQMKVLREGLEKGINVKPFAYPDYNPLSMMYYIDCVENKIDIKQFLSPKYKPDQLFQLALASECGLNIEKLCNPKLGADEMSEIRERLEANIWSDQLVKKDGSWA
jgi:hypothetical protein